mmetsp:Transcript_3245/g.2788  ORF Transcript_3245/g.2788 Transcript_3245/m.2788 type:complete len:126 (+) Transcript_3245:468-845(+)
MGKTTEDAPTPHEGDWGNKVMEPVFHVAKESSDSQGWKDPKFPHDESVIGDEVMKKNADMKWYRCTELMDKGREDLISKIDACVVAQGALSDCWLISAIAGLCEFPSFIQNTTFKGVKKISVDGK